ncbi:hypothetical protein J3A83DRAFT_2895145 [Scleroderma citrinum]
MSRDDAIKSFLWPSEISRVTLDVELASEDNSSAISAERQDVRSNNTDTLRDVGWLLSIIAHESGESEQASFFVFKLNPNDSQLQVHNTHPITADVMLSVAQGRRQSLNAFPPHSLSSSPITSAFILTIKTISENTTLQTFLTRDVQKLQVFSREYRRLKEILRTS